MKKSIVIIVILLAGFTVKAQADATPKMAKGTTAKRSSGQVVNTIKPMLAAKSKVPTATNGAVVADMPKPQMAVGSKK